MLRKNPCGHLPDIHPTSHVDDSAILCGKIVLAERVFVGPYAVIRSDEVNEQGEMDGMRIGAGTNIQDGVVLHSLGGAEVRIGEGCSIAHRAIVHGPCEISDHVFVGFNSILFRCRIGKGCVIEHGAVVSGRDLPDHTHVPCMTCVDDRFDLDTLPKVSGDHKHFASSVAETNQSLLEGYKKLGDNP